jgi:ARG/rhodanese/phosphatase superfamily protein
MSRTPSFARTARLGLGLLAAVMALPGAAGADDNLDLDARTRVGAPVSYQNLTVFPLYATNHPKDAGYLVLDEGMATGKVKVTEMGRGGSVNQLTVENQSQKPLFLMAGEVILGGQQDRIIGQDTIVPARTTQSVAVFCVEHGRWTGGKEFQSGKAMAHQKLRDKANFEGQQKVWDEVAAKNATRKIENATGTYRDVATESSADLAKTVTGYERTIGAGLAKAGGAVKRPDGTPAPMVGVAVAIDGEVVGIERFASGELFQKVQGKLLRSYYLQAVDSSKPSQARPAAEAVGRFAKEAKDGTPKVVQDGDAARTEHLENEKVLGTRLSAKPAAPPAAGAAARPAEEPVYESVHAAH